MAAGGVPLFLTPVSNKFKLSLVSQVLSLMYFCVFWGKCTIVRRAVVTMQCNVKIKRKIKSDSDATLNNIRHLLYVSKQIRQWAAFSILTSWWTWWWSGPGGSGYFSPVGRRLKWE